MLTEQPLKSFSAHKNILNLIYFTSDDNLLCSVLKYFEIAILTCRASEYIVYIYSLDPVNIRDPFIKLIVKCIAGIVLVTVTIVRIVICLTLQRFIIFTISMYSLS